MISPRPTPLVDKLLESRPYLWEDWNSHDFHLLEGTARQLERDLAAEKEKTAELIEALRAAIPQIGRFDFNPVVCPQAHTHTFGTGQSGYTINDNQEAGMVRCHTCGHRWQSTKPNEVAEKARKLLARLEAKG